MCWRWALQLAWWVSVAGWGYIAIPSAQHIAQHTHLHPGESKQHNKLRPLSRTAHTAVGSTDTVNKLSTMLLPLSRQQHKSVQTHHVRHKYPSISYSLVQAASRRQMRVLSKKCINSPPASSLRVPSNQPSCPLFIQVQQRYSTVQWVEHQKNTLYKPPRDGDQSSCVPLTIFPLRVLFVSLPALFDRTSNSNLKQKKKKHCSASRTWLVGKDSP